MTATTPRPTTDQRRAAHAWKAIEAILRKHPHQLRDGKPVPHDKAKNYGDQVKDQPTRVLASGLGQAIAFRWAKGKDNEQTKDLLRYLGDWVLDKRANDKSTKPEPEPQALIRKLVADDTDSMFLRRATEEGRRLSATAQTLRRSRASNRRRQRMSWTIPLPARTAQLAKGSTHP